MARSLGLIGMLGAAAALACSPPAQDGARARAEAQAGQDTAVQLPAEVIAQRDRDVAACREDGGADAEFAEGDNAYLQQGDFNGDGVTDFIIFHGGYECVGADFHDRLGCAPSQGCTFYTFTSEPDGRHTRSEGWMVESLNVQDENERDELLISDAPHTWNGQTWVEAR